MTRLPAVLVALLALASAALLVPSGPGPYPLMLPELLLALLAAGVTAAARPALSRPAGAVAVVAALQVSGIGVVAIRGWRSFFGADGQAGVGGVLGARLSLALTVLAATAAIAGAWLAILGPPGRPHHAAARPWTGPGPRGGAHHGRAHHAAARRWTVVAACAGGFAVAVAVPVVLGGVLDRDGPAAVAQFAVWWSLPWGAGLVAAGALGTPAARRAAAVAVAVSVVLAFGSTAAAPALGFGARPPETAADRRARNDKPARRRHRSAQ